MEGVVDPTTAVAPTSAPVVAADGALPAELERFLRLVPRPLIVIRGTAGSGKSMLAARILSRVRGPKVWVGTRSSMDTPASHGVRDGTPEFRSIGLGISEGSRRTPWSEVRHARRVLLGETGTVDDSAVEWLPPGVDEAWKELQEAEPGGMVIDTWDGLLDVFLDSEPSAPVRREAIEHLLAGRFAERNSLLVLISEESLGPALDHRADAVLQTAMGEIEERSIRVMTIPKLRSVGLDETIFPYTLDAGQFRYLPRTALDLHGIGRGTDADPAPEPRSIWPGSAPFAAAFGRLPVGRASLLEREEAVPAEILLSIATAAGISVLQRGGRLLLVPPIGVNPERLYELYRRAVPRDVLARSLRVLTLPSSDRLPTEAPNILIPILPAGHEEVPMVPYAKSSEEEAFEPISPGAEEFLEDAGMDPHPALLIADIPGFVHLVASVGRTPTPALLSATLRSFIEHRALHVMGTGTLGEPLLDPLRNLARPRVRLLTRRGRVFALGDHPWTSAFVVLPAPLRGAGAPYDLLRVS